MPKIWHSLEAIAGQIAVLKWWRFYLESEFEIARQYLMITPRLACSFPTNDFRHSMEVVTLPSGNLVAYDNREQERYELVKSDIALYRFDSRKLLVSIGHLLDCRIDYGPVAGAIAAWSVGNLPASLGGRPVFFCAPCGSSILLDDTNAIAMQTKGPFLLLTPTSRKLDRATQFAITMFGGVCIALETLYELDSESGEVRLRGTAIETLHSILGSTPEPTHVFRLAGGNRTLKFAGKEISLSESVGLFYLSRVLSTPGQSLTVAELASARTGMESVILSGATGKVFDEEAKLDYKNRIAELDHELHRSKTDNDWAVVEQQTIERDQIIDSLLKATGLGGRMRENTDMDKARKRVSIAISREIKRIQKHHAELGLHLKQTIKNGMTICYEPPHPVVWEM